MSMEVSTLLLAAAVVGVYVGVLVWGWRSLTKEARDHAPMKDEEKEK